MTAALALSSLIFLSLGAGPVKANRPGEARLSQGQAEFNRGNFGSALKLLDAAAADTSDDATLAKIHLLRGQAYAAEQDFDGAEGAFKLALEHDPEASLDPARVDPKLVRMLDGLRERMKGELNVRAEVPGSKISIDGRYAGESPMQTSQPIGRHRVEVTSPDGRRKGQTDVVVWPRRTTELPVQQQEAAERKPDEPPSASARLRGVADLRGNWNPLELLNGLGFEIGGGVEREYLRASLHLRLFPSLGLTPRGGLHVPINEKIDGIAELELPLLFGDRGAALGIGGAGGAEYNFSQWISAFAELGFRYFFLQPGPAGQSQLFLQGGVRLRLPK